MDQSKWPKWINQDHHANYLQNFLFNQLPSNAKSIDPQKMLILYALVTSSISLGQSIDNDAIIQYIHHLGFKNENELLIGFIPSPMIPSAEPHVIHSYCAISSLKMLGDNKIIDICINNKNAIIEWIMKLMNQDGSIRGSLTSQECDLRMVYGACSYLDLLGINFEQEMNHFKKQVTSNILACQNNNGAFGLQPNLESHGGATYCAISTLLILGQTIPNQTQLIRWLVDRQVDLGLDDDQQKACGFQGRVGKAPDSCYSFWCGWSLALIQQKSLIEFESLSIFLEACQSPKGGFSKYPNDRPDPIHTLHSLLGLMLQNQQESLDLKHALII